MSQIDGYRSDKVMLSCFTAHYTSRTLQLSQSISAITRSYDDVKLLSEVPLSLSSDSCLARSLGNCSGQRLKMIESDCNSSVALCHCHFTARAYVRAVLGVVILSVCRSVCLSHACIVTKLNDGLQTFLYHMKEQSLCYSDTKSGWSATPPSL